MAAIGENELALTQFKRSLDGGYVMYRALVREDPFLDPVRATPEFQELVERAESRYRESLDAFVDAGGERLLGPSLLPDGGGDG